MNQPLVPTRSARAEGHVLKFTLGAMAIGAAPVPAASAAKWNVRTARVVLSIAHEPAKEAPHASQLRRHRSLHALQGGTLRDRRQLRALEKRRRVTDE